jgi:hypothetical protein
MKNYTFIVIILAIFFGVMAGLAGQIISRYYFSDDLASFSLNREFDLLDGRSNLIIHDPRKVVVSHDAKIEETKKIISPSFFKLFSLNLIEEDYLFLDNPLSLALVISSDAWLMSILPEELKDINEAELIKDLIVVDIERNIYNISQVKLLNNDDLSLIFLKVDDLNNTKVRNVLKNEELKSGLSLLAFQGENKMTLASLIDHGYTNQVFSSQDFNRQLSINTCQQFSTNSYIFNLAGDFVGLNDASGNFQPALILSIYWRAILSQVEEISKPYLGIHYLNLSKVKFLQNNYNRGAMIYGNQDYPAFFENSPAELAGLEFGDVISHVNGLEIKDNLDLADYILSLNYGDEIRINYYRQGEEDQVTINLEKINYDN